MQERYVEIDGREHDYDQLTVHRKIKCDGCGEYISADSAVTGGQVTVSAGGVVLTTQFDAHPIHGGAAAEKALARILPDLYPF